MRGGGFRRDRGSPGQEQESRMRKGRGKERRRLGSRGKAAQALYAALCAADGGLLGAASMYVRGQIRCGGYPNSSDFEHGGDCTDKVELVVVRCVNTNLSTLSQERRRTVAGVDAQNTRRTQPATNIWLLNMRDRNMEGCVLASSGIEEFLDDVSGTNMAILISAMSIIPIWKQTLK
eukprot:764470-Hanusia_phi.AAC.3